LLLRGDDALAELERALTDVGDVGGEGRDIVEAVAGAWTGVGTGTGSGAGIEDLVGAGAVNDDEPNASNEGLAEPVSDLGGIPNASSNETPLLAVPVPLLVTLLAPNASSNENAPGAVGVEVVLVSLPLEMALGNSKLSSNEFWKLNPEVLVSSWLDEIL
jgi:hypothetical protein